MRIRTDGGLAFPPEEASFLGSIFRGYYPNNHSTLPTEEKNEISLTWGLVSEAVMYRLINLDEGDEFPSDYPEIITTNSNNAVGKAIGWAAMHFVPGSAFLTEWAGVILDSDYMGIIPEGAADEFGEELPRDNDGMANSIAGSLLQAGKKAHEWTIQLLEARTQ